MNEGKIHGKEQDVWNFISIIFFVLVFVLMYYFFIKDNVILFSTVSLLDIFLLSFATLRTIRLLSYDKVSSFMRDFFNKKEKGIGKTTYELLICPWCTGIWVALFLIPVYFLTEVGKIFVLILAIAGIGSFLQVIVNSVGSRKIIIG